MTAALQVVSNDEPGDTANQWDALVERGRVAAQSQWVLGDLALEVETVYGERRLQEYADAISVEYGSIRRYRDVSKAYESAKRFADVPWSVHMVLAGQPDRHELLKSRPSDHGVGKDRWTVGAARKLVKQRKDEDWSVEDMWDQACKRAVRALIALNDAYRAVASSGDPKLLLQADMYVDYIKENQWLVG